MVDLRERWLTAQPPPTDPPVAQQPPASPAATPGIAWIVRWIVVILIAGELAGIAGWRVRGFIADPIDVWSGPFLGSLLGDESSISGLRRFAWTLSGELVEALVLALALAILLRPHAQSLTRLIVLATIGITLADSAAWYFGWLSNSLTAPVVGLAALGGTLNRVLPVLLIPVGIQGLITAVGLSLGVGLGLKQPFRMRIWIAGVVVASLLNLPLLWAQFKLNPDWQTIQLLHLGKSLAFVTITALAMHWALRPAARPYR